MERLLGVAYDVERQKSRNQKCITNTSKNFDNLVTWPVAQLPEQRRIEEKAFLCAQSYFYLLFIWYPNRTRTSFNIL